MSTQKSSNDPFEEALRQKTEELYRCQESQNLTIEIDGIKKGSCMSCEKLVGCDLRRSYVAAVYSSMSKGDTGGFDF